MERMTCGSMWTCPGDSASRTVIRPGRSPRGRGWPSCWPRCHTTTSWPRGWTRVTRPRVTCPCAAPATCLTQRRTAITTPVSRLTLVSYRVTDTVLENTHHYVILCIDLINNVWKLFLIYLMNIIIIIMSSCLMFTTKSFFKHLSQIIGVLANWRQMWGVECQVLIQHRLDEECLSKPSGKLHLHRTLRSG